MQSNGSKGDGASSVGEVVVYKADISHSGGSASDDADSSDSGGSGSDDA